MQTREIKLQAINQKEACRYMGFRGTEPDPVIQVFIDEAEKELLQVMRPKFIYKVFDIHEVDEGVELEGTNLTLQGKSIKEHLVNCEKAVVMCATLSGDVDKLIRRFEAEQMLKTMAADALANAAIEQVCDAAELFIAADLPQYQRTWRFGVGYGDFPLDTQTEFLNILDAPKFVGVCATENSILTPRKSVTCVIGLSKQVVEKEHSCANCSFNDRCSVSKNGGSCGGK